MLVRLLYASRAVDASAPAIAAIVAESRAHNADTGVTGILCHSSGTFLQAIEGGRMAVNALYGHIQRDARHKDVMLLQYEEIFERRFGSWTMGQVNLSRLNASTLLKYSEKPELDPYSVSGTAALALLEELMATAAICARS